MREVKVLVKYDGMSKPYGIKSIKAKGINFPDEPILPFEKSLLHLVVDTHMGNCSDMPNEIILRWTDKKGV